MSDKHATQKLVGLLTEYKHIICIIAGSLVISTILNFCIPLTSSFEPFDNCSAPSTRLSVPFAIFFVPTLLLN